MFISCSSAVLLWVLLERTRAGDVIVSTLLGKVRGARTEVEGRDVHVFRGIPYATVRVRFRRPQAAERWEGTLDALKPPPSCPEVPYPGEIPPAEQPSTPPDEDCLFLSLWVPQGCPDDKMATMVWIHGGGFQLGSSTAPLYDGGVLAATQCVIVTTLNYRLGPFGFLYVGDERAPGNMGLLDQNMALRWVQQNVEAFGGSRRRITLFGNSAGAVSVGYHMVSKLSRDLFDGAILQSGNALTLWAHTSQEKARQHARDLARLVSCPAGDDEMVACLSRVNSTELGLAVQKIPSVRRPAMLSITDGYFLEDDPQKLLRNGRLNYFSLLLGATRDEGTTYFGFIYPHLITSQQSRPDIDQKTFAAYARLILRDLLETPEPSLRRVFNEIKVQYQIPPPQSGRNHSYFSTTAQLLGDTSFFCTNLATAQQFPKVFLYSYEHRTSTTEGPEWMGVMHSSELGLTFGRPFDQPAAFTSEERRLSSVMMTAWSNFAKYGDPNGEKRRLPIRWPSLWSGGLPYATFKLPDFITVSHELRQDVCSFWLASYPQL